MRGSRTSLSRRKTRGAWVATPATECGRGAVDSALKCLRRQLVADGLHSVFEWSMAGKYEAAFLHHADRRSQFRQSVGDHYLDLGMAEGPTDQGADRFCAIAVPLLGLEHAI